MRRHLSLSALLSAAALLAGCTGLSSNAPVVWEGPPPEQPIVWVYTREFAERFGMPPENIDDSLRGAWAVFMRVYPETLAFPHKNVVSIMSACQIGLFLKPGAFPRELWLRNDDFGYQHVGSTSSLRAFRERKGLSTNSAALKEEELFMSAKQRGYNGYYFLSEYHKNIFPNIDYILLDMMCGSGIEHHHWIHLTSKTSSYQYIQIPDNFYVRWHQFYSNWTLGDAKQKWKSITDTPSKNNNTPTEGNK